ncbi:glucosaminidase domain-containing protein [Streptococcus didelphis]|uniref:Glucosaminidase domain-containing protein n=1 Tax=Streptococcus didelphis TaxID=102886 RepID=A0ABY9LKR8_9STRE|nr:glucosaminidase domain-containing protein [Streptococcus didelphis]WMB28691.1 glucosaminidase domain-containing protein [Streptococcus didelphis]WMB29340.1 glucosaminidase domain-containing protein [Streptococcus didelphis]
MRERLKLKSFLLVFFSFLFLLIVPLLFNATTPFAQKQVKVNYSEKTYLATIAEEVKPYAKVYGIRPSVVIGQILLDTQNGQSLLSYKYHNLFSLPARPGQGFKILKTNRPIEGHAKGSKVAFAYYSSRKASIEDYFMTLRKGEVWDKNLYRLLATDKGYKGPARVLGEYLYPENKSYPEKLITVIEEKKLTSYDK